MGFFPIRYIALIFKGSYLAGGFMTCHTSLVEHMWPGRGWEDKGALRTYETICDKHILLVKVGPWWPQYLTVSFLLDLYTTHLQIHKNTLL